MKPIPRFEGYYATKDGRIFSTKRGDSRELSQWEAQGYTCVKIGPKPQLVHRLVLAAFEGWKPYPEYEVRHLDGDSANNHIDNLKWGTCAENYRDMRDHGTLNFVTLSVEQVIEIRERYAEGGVTQKELAKDYPVSRTGVQAIVNGRTWKDVGGPVGLRRTNGEPL